MTETGKRLTYGDIAQSDGWKKVGEGFQGNHQLDHWSETNFDGKVDISQVKNMAERIMQ